MSYLFSDLEIHVRIMLTIALFFIFIYEAINGFHDAANSVVTVIYTYALPSRNAIIMSGIFNFLGVMLSGLSVAYTIIHLLPLYLFNNISANHILAMIFSMLFAAILWNLGTWYLRLPTSSSHTLIGTLIGIGITNSILLNYPLVHGLNITKLINISLSLIISPIIGLILAKTIILLLYKYWNNNNYEYGNIHITPSEQAQKIGTRQPSLLIRSILIISSAGVSFSHGANDGQKGIGLIMLLLIGVAPASFMLNMDANTYVISHTKNAIHSFQKYYIQNYKDIQNIIPSEIISMPIPTALNHLQTITPSLQEKIKIIDNNTIYYKDKILSLETKNQRRKFFCELSLILNMIHDISVLLENVNSYTQLNTNQRYQIRQLLICIIDVLDQIITRPETPYKNRSFIKNLKKNLTNTIEYAPIWIILAVALSLSIGTVIGWKRITTTIGEKIGTKEMTYAQGVSAQLTTAISIGTASYVGMPVSTTHVLSAAVIGSMLIHGWGVQKKIIQNILITWILTLPVSITLSGSFYWLILKLLSQYMQI